MPKFYLNFVGFIILLIFFDIIIGTILNMLYFYPNLKAQDEISYAFNNSKAQIIIYGSSTANNHFNSKIIKDRTDLSCYNAGRAGQSILYVQALNRSIIKRYSPEIVILNLDWTIYDIQSLEKLGALLPFYANHPEIRELIINRSSFERLKLFSSIYPFNSEIYMIGRQFLGTPRDTLKNGYSPEIGSLKLNLSLIKNDLENGCSINPLKIKAFNELINCYKSKKINLILTITPIYDTTLVNNQLFSFADSMAISNNLPFLNFSMDKRFYQNSELFLDQIHLNSEGADLFSQIFADSLIQVLDLRKYN